MIDKLLSHLAPHPCYLCGKIGSILCDHCKYDIIEEEFLGCVLCGSATIQNGVCLECSTVSTRGWCVGERIDVLRKIIDDYKFERVYEAHKVLAALLAERLPLLPENTVIVPVPSIPAHIRERGYDHILLIAKELARLKKVRTEVILKRQTFSVQRGRTKKERHFQAKRAYAVGKTSKNLTILLIDDIVTTGATLQAAASLLRQHGAKEVWVACIARQPLEKK